MRAEYRGGSAPIQLLGSVFRLHATRGIVSADVRENALQLVERVIADDQLAFALLTMADLHRRAQALGQALLETGNIRVGFDRLRGLLFATQPLANQSLGLTYGQPSCDNVSRPFNLLIFRQTEQCPGMTHFQVAVDSMVLITSGNAIRRNKLATVTRDLPTASATCC